MLTADVVVAGGGVAGLLLASALGTQCSVILLEQRHSVPLNKYWLTDARSLTDNPDLTDCAERCFTFMDFIAYDGLRARVKGGYCLWNTDRVTALLRHRLDRAGVRVLLGHRLYSVSLGNRGIDVRANSRTLRARLLVDCMGFGSPLVAAKGAVRILGYYLMHGREVTTRAEVDPVGLDNVLIDRRPVYFELFPTARGTAHAAVILASHHYRADRPLHSDLRFILEKSHYSEKLVSPSTVAGKTYYGTIPVGRLRHAALDRLVFFGEAGQSNPAASATGFTRMLRTYRSVAAALIDCLNGDNLGRHHLVRAVPAVMSQWNRAFHESLFEKILDFDSDGFRAFVRELGQTPPQLVNDLMFADVRVSKRNVLNLAAQVLRHPFGVLTQQLFRSLPRSLGLRASRSQSQGGN